MEAGSFDVFKHFRRFNMTGRPPFQPGYIDLSRPDVAENSVPKTIVKPAKI